MEEDKLSNQKVDTAGLPEYQPPAIEEVLSRSEFEREVAYAGVSTNLIN